MKLLLDTHAWLWMLIEPERIGPKTRALLAEPGHTFMLSVASVWELAVKHAAGRVSLPETPFEYVQSRTRADGVGLLPMSVEHVCRAASLDRHHGDPFDRVLVAQAQIEGLVIVTHDQHIPRYEVAIQDPAD